LPGSHFQVEKPALLEAAEARLRKAGAEVVTLPSGIKTIDPWGTRVRLLKV